VAHLCGQPLQVRRRAKEENLCPKSKIIKLDSASQNPENQWANSSNEMLFNFE
jgi:hypothetical protein